MTIYELIERVRERPGLYFGKTSVSRLSAFISGYYLALYDIAGKEIDKDEKFSANKPLPFWYFNEFVAKKLWFRESTAGWCGMIVDKYGDDKAAFVEFLKLFDEFAAMRITSCKRAELTEENKQFCRDLNISVLRVRNGRFCDGGLFNEPAAVYIAALSAGYELVICECTDVLQLDHHFTNLGEGESTVEKYFGRINNLAECAVSDSPFNKEFEII